MVGTSVVTSYWTCCLSLLVSSWPTVTNWFPIKHGIYVGGITNCQVLGTHS